MGSIAQANGDAIATKACSPLTGGKRLKEMLKDPSKVVVCPGVFDGLTARLALAAGFDALYMVFSAMSVRYRD
jgi:2-methylisocitrate lyase-like PEP mutase family enzyme